MKYPSTSVVIATYNAKDYLELVLLSLLEQTIRPIEILIADDGSSDGTKEMIDKIRGNFGYPLIHVWQEDNGFKKAAIMNKTLAKAKGEYIIHIDGDVLLDKNFIADHLYVAKQGFMSTGSRAQISEKLKDKLLKTKDITLSVFTSGISRRQNAIRCKSLIKYFLDSYKKNIPYFARGCNMAFWKNDFIAVNGFNEDILHIGTEDFEFVARLNNINIKRQYIKFGAIQYHIYHKKRAGKTHPENFEILTNVIQNKVNWNTNGVDKYI